MDLDEKPYQEIEELLRLLAEFVREELELIMEDRRDAERIGQLH